MQPVPLPEGAHTVNPYLVVDDPEGLIAFLAQAFGAREVERMSTEGRITHAEVIIGDSTVMIGGARGRSTSPAMLYLYVDDCDAAYASAVAAGAASIMEPADMFYGDRHGGVEDAFGNTWWIATHIEDVPPDELIRRNDVEQQRRKAAAG